MAVTFTNEGQKLLAQQVEKHGTLRVVAGLVEINENQLGHYHRGTRKPLIPARNRLQAKLRIPFFSWDKAPVEKVSERSEGTAA